MRRGRINDCKSKCFLLWPALTSNFSFDEVQSYHFFFFKKPFMFLKILFILGLSISEGTWLYDFCIRAESVYYASNSTGEEIQALRDEVISGPG